MSEFGQSISNYTMLTEHLHLLFRCYILSGRMRAPPEFELQDLIPTFHPGAKTNRRALQSKFKSWARRMDIRNGKLVLTSTGKLIIPEEKCDELILSLHFQDHLPVDQVILQIRRNYTWTKKNFGMDRETVTNVISKNCPNAECRREMRKDFSNRNYSKILFPGPLLPSVMPTQLVPSPLMFAPDWAMNFPSPRNISAAEYSIPPNIFNNTPTVSHVSPAKTLIPPSWYKENRKVESKATDIHMPIPLPERYLYHSNNTGASTENSPSLQPCKKVRNIYEFHAVLKASKSMPKAYPHVLSHPKTHFFSTLGLVPKKICTKNTLSRFRRELRRRRTAKKRLRRGPVGKVLRDRNKLTKTRLYAQEVRRRQQEPPKQPKRRILGTEALKIIGATKIGQASQSSLCSAPKPEPELIDIASSSSDEECLVVKQDNRKEDFIKQRYPKRVSPKIVSRKPVPAVASNRFSVPTSSGNAAGSPPSSSSSDEGYLVIKHDYGKKDPKKRRNPKRVTPLKISKKPVPNAALNRFSIPTSSVNAAGSPSSSSSSGEDYMVVKHDNRREELMKQRQPKKVSPLKISRQPVPSAALSRFIIPNSSGNADVPSPSSSSSDEDYVVIKRDHEGKDLIKQRLPKRVSPLKISKQPVPKFLIPTSTGNAAVLPPSGFHLSKPVAFQNNSFSFSGFHHLNSKPEVKNTIECDQKAPSSTGVVRPIAIRPLMNPIVPNPMQRLEPNNYKIILVEKKSNGSFHFVNSYPAPLCQPKPFPSIRVKQPIAPRIKGPVGSQENSQLLAFPKQSLSTQESTANIRKDKDPIKRDADFELKKFYNWVDKTRVFFTSPVFRQGSEKATQKLTAHLNNGIYLVREIRRALIEIEKNNEDVSENQDATGQKIG